MPVDVVAARASHEDPPSHLTRAATGADGPVAEPSTSAPALTRASAHSPARGGAASVGGSSRGSQDSAELLTVLRSQIGELTDMHARLQARLARAADDDADESARDSGLKPDALGTGESDAARAARYARPGVPAAVVNALADEYVHAVEAISGARKPFPLLPESADPARDATLDERGHSTGSDGRARPSLQRIERILHARSLWDDDDGSEDDEGVPSPELPRLALGGRTAAPSAHSSAVVPLPGTPAPAADADTVQPDAAVTTNGSARIDALATSAAVG